MTPALSCRSRASTSAGVVALATARRIAAFCSAVRFARAAGGPPDRGGGGGGWAASAVAETNVKSAVDGLSSGNNCEAFSRSAALIFLKSSVFREGTVAMRNDR